MSPHLEPAPGDHLPIDPSTAFVSYSREDMEFAVRLAKDLKAKGAKVWMDKIDIRPGQRWEAEIETAVDGSSRMLVILSPAAIASPNVLAEASLALDEGKSVIPVLYRDCRVPFRLRPFQYADFRSDYSVGLEELLASLGGGHQAVSGPEAIALSAISEALGLDPAPPIPSSSDAAKERERQQEALKQQEQAESKRLAAAAELERKQQEEAEAARLAAEAERQRREQAEAERKQHEQVNATQIAVQEDENRKQREAEAARLAATVEHKTPRQAEAKKSDPSRIVAILLGVLLLVAAGLALKASVGLLWIMVGLVVGWATAMIKGGGGGIPVLGIFGGIIGAVVSGTLGRSLGLMDGNSMVYNVGVPIIGAVLGALVISWFVVSMIERIQG
jgi:uncharacterized membrane protein YeaQ/YmgE (transglycosylase-associated protein family)